MIELLLIIKKTDYLHMHEKYRTPIKIGKLLLVLILVFPIIITINFIVLGSNNEFFEDKNSPNSSNSYEIHQESIDIIDTIELGNSIPVNDRGILTGADYNIFWWIHITDTQSMWWNHKEDTPKLGEIAKAELFFNTTAKLINPVFIANTGDLVGSDYSYFFKRNRGQIQEEWEIYNATVSQNWNYTNYFDINGNHDTYRDPGFEYYRNYSITGSYTNTDQYLVNLELPWGKYSFYMLSVIEGGGFEYPWALGGHMSGAEMAWFENKLESNKKANLSFAFGHQPLLEIMSALSPEKHKSMIGLMDEYNVDYYAMGHGHDDLYQKINDIPCFESPKLGSNGTSFRIVAIDNDGISENLITGDDQYPIGIITNPIDEKLTFGKFDINSDKHQNPTKIRVLAWDPDGISTVKWRHNEMDDGLWNIMTNLEGPLYEADWESVTNENVEVFVNITNVDGDSKIESIVYNKEEISYIGLQHGIYAIVIAFIGLIVVLPIGLNIWRRRNPEKRSKKKWEEVDTIQAKLLIVKLLILIFVPLSIVPILADTPVALFSFITLSSAGFIYSDTTYLVFGILAILGLLPHSLRLSERRRFWMILGCIISILVEIFLIWFFFKLYGLWGLTSFGLFGVIFIDILMIKRAVELQKQHIIKK